MIVYGEGCIAFAFMGSLWMKDDLETEEEAEYRYSRVMTDIGFKFLPEQGL